MKSFCRENEHSIGYCICGQSGRGGIEVRSFKTTTVEWPNERHRARLASREAGDGAHWDRERGKPGPDGIRSEMVATAVSHVRR